MFHVPSSEYQRRLGQCARSAQAQEIGAVIISPGEDLEYLTGYRAVALERLTALIVRDNAPDVLIVPALETAAAMASPVAALEIEVVSWHETEDPIQIVAKQLSTCDQIAVSPTLWSAHLLAWQSRMSQPTWTNAANLLHSARAVKSQVEIDALTEAGAAIDSVHARIPDLIQPGRTEREVAHDIATAIIESGHARVDFVIVASGPNGASPHHEVSDRVIEVGDPIVVDIGGTMPSGYCSDSTRNYCLGTPPQEYEDYYEVLFAAQTAAVAAVRPGMSGAQLDAVARDAIAAAGYGDYFIHRTGHGIGLGTHEEPYIVASNDEPLQVGNAFSIEPGIYFPGRHGARIEDIVVCQPNGAELLNHRPRQLHIID